MDVTDATQTPCATLGEAPAGAVTPEPGELFYIQLGLGGFGIGESALMIGPDGTVVAFDVGNDSHDDDIASVLEGLADQMSAAGFPSASADEIDHVVLTHYHADHSDGITDLLERVTLTGQIVFRGIYEFTEAANRSTMEKVCRAVEANRGFRLCAGVEPSDCDANTWSGAYHATGCPGLAAGSILDPDDARGTSFLPLGSAKLEFLGANGEMAGESYATEVAPIDEQDGNGENARSVVALARHGHFRMLLTGDITGGGDGTDDIESFYAPRLDRVSDIDERGVDVLHAGHHGRKTSSNATWLARLLPADGWSRNVVMGVSSAHLNSPHGEVLGRIEAQGLQDGRIWTTAVTIGADTSTSLVDADGGHVIVKTVAGGDGYVVQAITEDGGVIQSGVFPSARCAPRSR